MNVLRSRRVAVVVRDEGAVLVLAEREREAIERPGRAVPRELVGEPLDARLESIRERLAQRGVHAVGGDDEIAAGECLRAGDRRPVPHVHARRARTAPAAGAATPAARWHRSRCRRCRPRCRDARCAGSARSPSRCCSLPCTYGASRARNSSAPWENTTPKPNVASGGFCSTTVMLACGRRRRASRANSSPAGPPPAIPIRMAGGKRARERGTLILAQGVGAVERHLRACPGRGPQHGACDAPSRPSAAGRG